MIYSGSDYEFLRVPGLDPGKSSGSNPNYFKHVIIVGKSQNTLYTVINTKKKNQQTAIAFKGTFDCIFCKIKSKKE